MNDHMHPHTRTVYKFQEKLLEQLILIFHDSMRLKIVMLRFLARREAGNRRVDTIPPLRLS